MCGDLEHYYLYIIITYIIYVSVQIFIFFGGFYVRELMYVCVDGT